MPRARRSFSCVYGAALKGSGPSGKQSRHETLDGIIIGLKIIRFNPLPQICCNTFPPFSSANKNFLSVERHISFSFFFCREANKLQRVPLLAINANIR
ncbi:hypothetical protein PUN28_013293 [Cardiocondyla obscurior]|uniref:Uncharacterized protein n=1 Tax=Cardiocondyla obscurior TaxID=286306 RepID=A0AAW2FAH3_9HYME